MWYVSQPGDWLSTIAGKFLGDVNAWPVIYNANIQVIGGDPDVLKAGTKLWIPVEDELPVETIERAPAIITHTNKEIDMNMVMIMGGVALGAVALLKILQKGKN